MAVSNWRSRTPTPCPHSIVQPKNLIGNPKASIPPSSHLLQVEPQSKQQPDIDPKSLEPNAPMGPAHFEFLKTGFWPGARGLSSGRLPPVRQAPLRDEETFTSFLPGTSNRVAVSAVKSSLVNSQTQGLCLESPSRFGKSHLINALRIASRESPLPQTSDVISVPNFAHEFELSKEPGSRSALMERLSSVDILCIEDSQYAADNPALAAVLADIIERARRSGARIVFTIDDWSEASQKLRNGAFCQSCLVPYRASELSPWIPICCDRFWPLGPRSWIQLSPRGPSRPRSPNRGYCRRGTSWPDNSG